MLIHSAVFVKSSPSLKDCPSPSLPEFAFIGRSNVGKSSLINMLTGHSKLAKISAQPGKTRTINHFIINDKWYLADLPGYGYAKVPVALRDKWVKSATKYLTDRENLVLVFVLIDIRHKPQKSDLDFLDFLGMNQVPLARVFTKSDKISASASEQVLRLHDAAMLERWESLPPSFVTSSVNAAGRDLILDYIEESINKFSNPH
ncbi:MAG: ribosome biogenesis GTP-binding protein YihA/YsxC [Bacteroidales bacterium]|jgi:GTP-binding protein|nr:ribosome biogenesis GTP-binding protein YihA/YsxC [Bacteroidales bacterium]MCU0407427.1 ribosome biogenesis GTP-binding protein YihA/YsxC [Bacteroidales bacterium]